MNLAQDFNALNGTTVNRKTLDYLLARAEKERHALIQTRIVKVLEAHPNEDSFTIKLTSLIEPYGLNAERHSGIEKEALTECGRLKKGYKYVKNVGIVKVEPKKTIASKKPVSNAQKTKKPAIKSNKTTSKSKKTIEVATTNIPVKKEVKTINIDDNFETAQPGTLTVVP